MIELDSSKIEKTVEQASKYRRWDALRKPARSKGLDLSDPGAVATRALKTCPTKNSKTVERHEVRKRGFAALLAERLCLSGQASRFKCGYAAVSEVEPPLCWLRYPVKHSFTAKRAAKPREGKSCPTKIAKTVEHGGKASLRQFHGLRLLRRKLPVLLLMIFPLFSAIFAQEKPKATLVDEFGKQCSEELMARLDNFLTQLNNNPNSTGLILFNGSRDSEGKNIRLLIYMTNYFPLIRKYDGSRIKLMRGENGDSLNIQFWIVPAGADQPRPNRMFVANKYAVTTLFDHSWTDFNKWSGKLEIYSDDFLDLGCGFGPNRGLFAKTMRENKTLNGFVIVYTAFGKGAARGHRIANFAIRDLVNNFGIPRKRLTAIYGGNREEPEIEFWLVPKGDVLPKLKPDNKKP